MTMPTVQQAPGGAVSADAYYRLQALARQRASHRSLTEEESTELSDTATCTFCFGWHVRACPRVKSMSWHMNHGLASVEFWPDSEIDWTGVIWDDGGDDTDRVSVSRADLLEVVAAFRVTGSAWVAAKRNATPAVDRLDRILSGAVESSGGPVV
jgi:hypothetical protein